MEEVKDFGRLTISRCSSRSSVWDPIPSDVLMEIISRLPAKSVGKCRCVCKVWAWTLGRPEFEELFLTKSLTRPQFLFAFMGVNRYPFFTSPQIQDPDHDKCSSPLVVTPHHMYLPDQICRPVRGWIIFREHRGGGEFVICNPITGKSITLPKLPREMPWVTHIMGYDPIGRQIKVLCSAWSRFESVHGPAEHYVLTLGTEQMVWRTIECSKPIRHLLMCGNGICINGFLYYIAEFNHCEDIFIVCFDIGVEKLSFINKPEGLWHLGIKTRLINHKGQLCIMQSSNGHEIGGGTKSFALWVLEDIAKQEWKKHIYKLHRRSWIGVVGNNDLCIVGMMTGTCEIVFSSQHLSCRNPFYLFYYNLESNIGRRVEIQGFEGIKDNKKFLAFCFLDYVENVKLM